jgi:hypothetical protein
MGSAVQCVPTSYWLLRLPVRTGAPHSVNPTRMAPSLPHVLDRHPQHDFFMHQCLIRRSSSQAESCTIRRVLQAPAVSGLKTHRQHRDAPPCTFSYSGE